LALVAGAVFAETSVGGTVNTGFKLAQQEGADGDDPVMGGGFGDVDISLTGTNSDGTLGGRFRLRPLNWDATGSAVVDDNSDHDDDVTTTGGFGTATFETARLLNQAFVWWKPIEQVRIFIGKDSDGQFDEDDIVGWGFSQGDQGFLFQHDWGYWRTIFPGNFGTFGLALSFYPVEGLVLNLALPAGGGILGGNGDVPISDPDSAHKNAGMFPGHLWFNGHYDISGIGKISFGYQGGGIVGSDNGLIGASFLLTAVEGIQVKVGGSIKLYETDNVIYGGLGFAYNGDGFGVRLRLGVTMYPSPAKPEIVAGVIPWLKVGDNGEALLDIGIVNDGNVAPGAAKLGWEVVPAYRLNIDGGSFHIGLKVYNNVDNQHINGAEYVKWALPMCLAFNF